ncbi:hypothetical protein CIPAW_05G098200 [Carya illinoinensis]|uniref:Uncharacterized protein n=1 Tax=Carya illinoinensis TaxID=32201 RepID=A0A8T1QHH9_CARIL|nr:hypothetical protein CIPAW_05G098200 [Carya illinoinensis]
MSRIIISRKKIDSINASLPAVDGQKQNGQECLEVPNTKNMHKTEVTSIKPVKVWLVLSILSILIAQTGVNTNHMLKISLPNRWDVVGDVGIINATKWQQLTSCFFFFFPLQKKAN